VDREQARELLEQVASGVLPVTNALQQLELAPLAGFADLGFARVDTHRDLRTGDAEVVYAAGKPLDQLVAIVRALRESGGRPRPILVTRLDEPGQAALAAEFPDLSRHPEAGCAVLGPLPPGRGRVLLLTAGTSDGRVAGEAEVTARVFGATVSRINDVGVAGLHRLLAAREALSGADVIIVVAGMEGALPSVVGGLVGVPIVAVPTSVGYGSAFGGLAALLAMLNSCAPGVAVVNIDNGFGAGVFAARVARSRAPVP
jgi:NCAIR mutase (PurE)-related protein